MRKLKLQSPNSRSTCQSIIAVLGLLLMVLLTPSLRAQSQTQTFKKGVFTDEELGFKLRPPVKWRQIPTKPKEQWIVGMFQSDKEYFSKEGASGRFLMRIIMFDKSPKKKKTRVKDNSDKDASYTIFGNRSLRYRNYREYVKQTLGGGGFFFTEEKELEKTEVPGMLYEVKVEKGAYVERRLLAWEFRRGDISFAVEFDIFEEDYKGLKKTMEKTLKTFKLLEVEDPSAAENLMGKGYEIRITDIDKWRKMPLDERHERRKADEARQHELLRSKLPKDWEVTETEHFLVISHADKKFTKKIVDIGDACWAYLEKRYGKLSDEYIRKSIIRICADYEEYKAYHFSTGSYFSISFGADVSEMQFYEGEMINYQWGYMMRELFDHYMSDLDAELWEEAPYWLTAGMRGYLYSCKVKGKKVTFEPSIAERVAISRLKKKGGFKKDILKEPKGIMDLTYVRYSDLRKAKKEPFYQCTHLVRFLEGKGTRHKLFKDKDFLVEYCRAGFTAAAQHEKENPGKKRDYKEATTEAEEEAYAAGAEERREAQSRAGETRNREVLGLLHQQACNWTEAEWKSLTKAYAKTCK